MSSSAAEIDFLAGDGCPPPFLALAARAALAARFAALVPHFPRAVSRVTARLVGDEAMDEAHRRFSGVAGTTDVLSFPAHDESYAAAAVEVDLIIAVPVAAREAAARGHDAAREILLYAVHGTLHACGYRDDDEASAAAIHAEEDRILAAGGVGAVYAVQAQEPPAGACGSHAPEGPTP